MAVEERISSELSLKFDQVILDTLMYSDVELTKVRKECVLLFFNTALLTSKIHIPIGSSPIAHGA